MTLKKNELTFITPNWPAPKNIKALCTTINGGVSQGNYATLNLADHVKDNPQHVTKNRTILESQLNLSLNNSWLSQTHSNKWLSMPSTKNNEADASYTKQTKTPCSVLTADCVPILFCNQQGDFVAAVHAGWQGVFNGITKKIKDYYPNTNELMAWIGPCIKQNAMEVSDDFYNDFIKQDAHFKNAFVKKDKWHFDMVAATKMQLQAVGITAIYGGDYCTYSDEQFFSYRQNNITGRIASMVWID